MSTLFESVFMGLSLLAALGVLTSAHPVYSVFCLVLVFCSCAVLRLTLSREFRALLFLRVYVGAIAVLFLFVVMRLNIRPDRSHRSLGNFPRIIGLSLGLLFSLVQVWSFSLTVGGSSEHYVVWSSLLDKLGPVESIGQSLFHNFWIEFLMAGLILLVAILAAVALTLSPIGLGGGAQRQSVHYQHSRSSRNALFYVR